MELPSRSSRSPIYSYRGRRVPAHEPQERAFVWVVGFQLCMLPWALGTVHPWSQIVAAALSIVSLIAALRVRAGLRAAAASTAQTFGRVLHSIPLLCTLALFGLIVTQALNPTWEYVREPDGRWWLQPLDENARAPSSAAAPFALSNSWRVLVVWGSTAVTALAISLGITRRASVRRLFLLLAINAAALALVALAQRGIGNGKILGFISPSTHYYVSTFLYKNHAAAYFNLLLGVTFGLAAWFHERARRKQERASPALLFVFCGTLLALAVVLSFSRAGTVLMLGIVTAAGLAALQLVRRNRHVSIWPMALAVVLIAGFVISLATTLQVEDATTRFQRLFDKDRAISVEARQHAAHATWDMVHARPWTGWGAGCFRYFFPIFQQKYPAIYDYPWEKDRRYYYEHAHNDYLEWAAELGLVGGILLSTLAVVWISRLVRFGFWRSMPALLVACGIGAVFLHSTIDFPLQCPAISITLVALAALIVRTAELEHHKRDARSAAPERPLTPATSRLPRP